MNFRTAANVIWWWEARRFPYNAALLVIGLVSIFIFEIVVGSVIQPGEDAIEPIALVLGVGAYAVGANLCYTLGWITEIVWASGDYSRTEPMRLKIFWSGFIFSCLLTTAPIFLAILVWIVSKVAPH